MSLPFPEVWWSSGIPGVREVSGTYGPTPLRELPVIDVPDDVSWLTPLEPELVALKERLAKEHAEQFPSRPYTPEEMAQMEEISREGQREWEERYALILSQAMQQQVQLPHAFIQLLSSDELMNQICNLSPTGNYFSLPPHGMTRAPLGLDGHIIRFYNDQQICLCWYLYVPSSGPAVVLAGGFNRVDYLEDVGPDADDLVIADVRQNLALVAHSFSEFLYRLWIESLLYYKCEYKLTLNAAERAYLGLK